MSFTTQIQRHSVRTKGRSLQRTINPLAKVQSQLRLQHKPLLRLIAFLGCLLSCYFLIGIFLLDMGEVIVTWAGPMSLGVAFVFTAYRIVITKPIVLWTPLPWFLLASAVYYGLGPTVYAFGNEDTLFHLRRFPADAHQLWRTNVLNACGTLIVLVCYVGCNNAHPRWCLSSSADGRRSEVANAARAAVVFLSVGLPTKYLFSLPHEFDLIDYLLPGGIQALANLTSLGLMMLSYLSTKRGGVWHLLFIVLLVAELIVSFLQFSKSAILIALIFASLGHFLARPRRLSLFRAGVVILVVFAAVQPLVIWCRQESVRQIGNARQMTLHDRADVLRLAIDELFATGTLSSGSTQLWWIRTGYAGVQAAAMSLYDNGYPGNSLSHAFYAVVPRLFWPEKPSMTEIGVDFCELLTGHRLASIGIGAFGEAYWNGGWMLVIPVCVYIGFLFAWLSREALLQMGSGNWLYLPCIFLGIAMGYRIDGWIVSSYVGSVAVYLVYLFFVSLVYCPRSVFQSRKA